MKKIFVFLLSVMLTSSVALSAMASDHKEGRKHYKKMFERMDSNGDGAITKDEFLSHVEKRFSKKDANGDGKITRDELKRYHKQKRKEKEDNDD